MNLCASLYIIYKRENNVLSGCHRDFSHAFNMSPNLSSCQCVADVIHFITIPPFSLAG